MIRWLMNWAVPPWALRGIGRVPLVRYDGMAVRVDSRLCPTGREVLDVPVYPNDYVPRGLFLDLTDPVDNRRRFFVHPEDSHRIFGGIFPWYDAPWEARR